YATRIAAPAVAPNKPNTCSAASFTTANGPARASGIPLDLASGGKNSVSFWMYWDGGNSQMPFGFLRYDLWLVNGYFGFNTSNSDVYGIASAGLANGWHHVAAVFTNGNVAANKLWIDGVPQTLSQRQASPSNTYAQAATSFQLSSWTYDDGYRFGGRLDEVKVYRGELTDALVQDDFTDICVVADWRLDEAAWSGAANEVKDSGGGQYHGTARVAAGSTPVPTTAADSPAHTSGGESTCAYGEFDSTTVPLRSHSYVELPTFPALPGSFTFAAWIRSTNAAAQHQRVLARDDANNGWGLSLADGTGRPELRFFSRNISNSGAVTGQGRNPNCGAFCLDSDPVITSNAWYYIAAAIDTGGKTVTLYVFDAAGVLLVQTSAGFAGTWQDGSGPVTIGGESATSAEGQQAAWHFLGNIDELRIFSGVLSAADIRNMQARTRTCTGGPAVRPANFNCVQTGADAASGHLLTQIAGSSFAFDVAALKADGSVETAYAADADQSVSVELVDGTGSTACAARPALSPALTQTLTFAKADQPLERGRKAVAGLVVDRAYADLRCRVTDSSRSPSVVGCSSDNFAVRPSALIVSSNADADVGGSSATAAAAIEAGKNFSLIAASHTVG
ncbi:MAG: LamG-like jellyroll fold domain-containing protein, partial [Propionivibrio sp.]